MSLLADLPSTKAQQVGHVLRCTEFQINLSVNFVDNLIVLHDIKQGTFIPMTEAFNPKTVVKNIVSIFKPQVKAKGIHIEAQFEED